MELVRAAALTGYFEVAAELRLDVVPLLRKAGLSRAMMINPEQMLPAVAVIGLLEDTAQASGCMASRSATRPGQGTVAGPPLWVSVVQGGKATHHPVLC